MSAVDFFGKFKASPVELFGVVFFKGKEILSMHILSEGDETGVTISATELMLLAGELGAEGMTLVHNHPSDNTRPSGEDLEATFEIQDRCKAVGVALVDHFIVGPSKHYSFKANGVI